MGNLPTQRPSEGAEGRAGQSPEEPRKKLGPTQSRHLHLRRRIPVAIFQPVGQVRREVRLEVKEPCGQDTAGPGPGRCPVLWILSALTRSSNFADLVNITQRGATLGLKPGPWILGLLWASKGGERSGRGTWTRCQMEQGALPGPRGARGSECLGRGRQPRKRTGQGILIHVQNEEVRRAGDSGQEKDAERTAPRVGMAVRVT